MFRPFKPLPTTWHPFLFLATTTGPGVVATISSDHPGIISTTSAATAPMGLPLQIATSGKAPSFWPFPPTPASLHRQRRPAGTYFATPAATAPVGLLLQSTTTASGVTVIVGYFGPYLPPIPATTPSSSPRKKVNLPPRTPQAFFHWPTVKDCYSVNACVYMYAAEHAHFTAEYAIRHLLQPTILGYYSLVFFHERIPTASSPNTPPLLVRARSSSTRFTGPSSVSSAPTSSSANTTTSPSRDRSAVANPSTTASRVSSDFSPEPTPSGSRINLRRVYCTYSRCTTCGSVSMQRHATGMSAPGYYRVESHLPYCLIAAPANHVS